jgi:hypothetical protein
VYLSVSLLVGGPPNISFYRFLQKDAIHLVVTTKAETLKNMGDDSHSRQSCILREGSWPPGQKDTELFPPKIQLSPQTFVQLLLTLQ